MVMSIAVVFLLQSQDLGQITYDQALDAVLSAGIIAGIFIGFYLTVMIFLKMFR